MAWDRSQEGLGAAGARDWASIAMAARMRGPSAGGRAGGGGVEGNDGVDAVVVAGPEEGAVGAFDGTAGEVADFGGDPGVAEDERGADGW